MFGLGVGEIVVILFIALIFIGPKKLPELARGLGKGMREFQNAARGLGDNLRNPVEEVKKQVMDQPEESQSRASSAPLDQPPDRRRAACQAGQRRPWRRVCLY